MGATSSQQPNQSESVDNKLVNIKENGEVTIDFKKITNEVYDDLQNRLNKMEEEKIEKAKYMVI